MVKKYFVVTAVVISLCFANSLLAQPTNGDFSSGLSGWTVEFGDVSDGGGYASFQDDDFSLSSTLSQVFTLEAGALELSFDVIMSSTSGGSYDPFAWPDSFTASLLNPVSYDPLVSNPDYTDFYFLDNWGFVETVASVSGNTVTLDVSSLAGQDVFLAFDLWNSWDDGMVTNVCLDNVSISGVSVIPAPSALLLAAMGTGLVGIWRRSKNGKVM